MPKIQEFLNKGLPNRVRNNHALEHATLHVLQEKGISGRFGGISDAGGFWIYGETETETLLQAAQEALQRLADGEKALAIHPNCGTNLAVGSLAAGALAWVGMRGTRGSASRRLARLPIAVLMGIIGYQLTQPLGPKIQEQLTTNADVSGMELVQVLRHDVATGITIHRVSTRLT